MTKDEALRMAIEAFDWEKVNKKCKVDILTMVMDFSNGQISASDLMNAIAYRCQVTLDLAYKDALKNLEKDPPISRKEQPAKEQLTDSQCDEFRRLPMSFNDMVRAIYKAGQEALEQPTDGIELEWYCKGWDDAEKDLATQEPKSPTILARLPNGTTASNVYEAYEAGLKEGKAETQKPVLVNATTHDGQTYKIEVSAPSREWVGLSDDEIDDVWFDVVKGNNFENTGKHFARAIEAKLKEKNELFGNSR